MKYDIMVDLETMDNVRSSAIVAIGAVQCDLTTGKTAETFYRVVDLKDQLDIGMTINSETLYWWLEQSEGARLALTVSGKILLTDMCKSFSVWLESLEGNTEHLRLWGNGASFDNAIIRYAYRRCNLELPIKFWNDRDMRTILGFYPKQMQESWRRNNIRKGVAHNALDDAKHQVRYCSDILRDLGVKELY